MAEQRHHVWLECTVCGGRNYRTDRRVKPDQSKETGSSACMVSNKLEMKKFCRHKCRRHTLHRESRKK